MRSILAGFGIVCLAAAASAAVQQPAGGKAGTQAPKPQSPAAQARADAKSALQAGDAARAQRLFLQSIWSEPGSGETLLELLKAAPDEDSRALWLHALLDATTDENGPARLDAATQKLASQIPSARKIATARLELVKEASRLVSKLGPADPPSILRWATELGREAARPAPLLAKRFGPSFDAEAKISRNPAPILAALEAAIASAFAQGKPEVALVAARILHGLATQAGFKDLASPAPALGSAKAAAADAMAKARAALRAREKDLPTLEQLEAMDEAAVAQFNAEHCDPGNPGVVISPTGLYRVETICGHATLVAAAKQVEFHHKRLVGWFGSDPFVGRQGIVRVVPEASDLEAEGAPFWWAGGFQSGDVTTLRFAHARASALGPGLTHELTHRFDGALYPGLPAWAAEGRAVWTGGAFANPEDERFITMYGSHDAMSETHRRGVTDEYVGKLIDGTIEEYRDNYTAGHALWVYLWSWEPDKQIFQAQIPKYLAGLKSNRGKEWFTLCFADGKDGRPKGFKAFVQGFRDFCQGFWWESRQPWSRRYVNYVEPREERLIYDRPTWQLSRDRHEPMFGQDHATDAGHLLLQMGNAQGAMAALEWAFDRDEVDSATGRALADLYERAGKADAAWAVRLRLHRWRPWIDARPTATPSAVVGSVATRLGQLLSTYAEAVEAAKSAGRPQLALAIAADHDRLAPYAARDPLPAQSAPGSESRPAALTHPICEPGVSLSLGGLTESKLAGFDEYRAAGLWHVTPGGDVVLGRAVSAPQTGLQRESYLAQTFARTRDSVRGAYGVSARVRTLTAYADGALIIGYQRHDRQLRVAFNLGDWAFANGRSEKESLPGSVNIQFGDLREREGALPGTSHHRSVPFKSPSTSFLLEVLVDGPWAHVFVNGEHLGSHCAATGLPIEGAIGFASGSGVLAFEQPTITYHRLVAGEDRCGCRRWPEGLRFDRPQSGSWGALLGQRVRPMPLTPAGSVLLWFPDFDKLELSMGSIGAEATIAAVKSFLTARKLDGLEEIPLVVALAASAAPEQKAEVRAQIEKLLGPKDAILEHADHAGYAEAMKEKDVGVASWVSPYLFFVDPLGVARVAETWQRSRGLPRRMRDWAHVLKGT